MYFWSFVVALLVFALGAGVSIYQGIAHVLQPEPISDPAVNYVVLALAFVFEGGSWIVSFGQFRAAKGSLGYYEAFRRSKDPPSFMVLFEDSAALAGIALAAFGTYAATSLGAPMADGIASILIGVVLTIVSVLLARESKSLLIGERADRALVDSVLRIAAAQPGIVAANGVLTVQLAPEQIVAALSLDFANDLSAREVEKAVEQLEQKVRAAHPNIVALFVKPQTDEAFRASFARRYGATPLPAAKPDDGRTPPS